MIRHRPLTYTLLALAIQQALSSRALLADVTLSGSYSNSPATYNEPVNLAGPVTLSAPNSPPFIPSITQSSAPAASPSQAPASSLLPVPTPSPAASPSIPAPAWLSSSSPWLPLPALVLAPFPSPSPALTSRPASCSDFKPAPPPPSPMPSPSPPVSQVPPRPCFWALRPAPPPIPSTFPNSPSTPPATWSSPLPATPLPITPGPSATFNSRATVQITGGLLSATPTLNGSASFTVGYVGGSYSNSIGASTLSGTQAVSAIEGSGSQVPVTINTLRQVADASLTIASTISLHITGAGNFAGNIHANGNLTADVAGALGTARIFMNDSTLTLNATNSARNDISGGSRVVFYNANGAAGGHNISTANLIIAPSVNSLSNGIAPDTLTNLTGLHANNSILSTLDRGLGGGSANVSFSYLATVESLNGTLPPIAHLGTASDLILGILLAGSSAQAQPSAWAPLGPDWPPAPTAVHSPPAATSISPADRLSPAPTLPSPSLRPLPRSPSP